MAGAAPPAAEPATIQRNKNMLRFSRNNFSKTMAKNYLRKAAPANEPPFAFQEQSITVNNHQLILQDSGKVEYYTPPHIVEAARRVMGGIDLDPASSAAANRTIQAKRFFSRANPDEWRGPWAAEPPGVRVWMNHPFNRHWNAAWIAKLIEEYEAGRVTQACCITWASTSEAWFRPLYAGLMCFLTPRTGYLLPSGERKRGATKGSVVTYLGHNVAGFIREFAPLGEIPNLKLLDHRDIL